MELRELLNVFRRWVWLLILGLLAGLAGGYFASKYMEPVYEASTKLMISREIQDENPDFSGLNSQQLVQTYVQILKTKPLLETTSERIGAEIDSEQVLIQQILDTQIIEIKVDDPNPEKSANIANTMVTVLIEQNEEMQTGQSSNLESRLTKQLEQVETNIDKLQTEFDQALEQEYQDQLKLVEEQISITQDELSTLQSDMALLRPDWRPEDKITMAEKQARVNQLQVIYGIYEEIHANLLILERPSQYSDPEISPRLQRLQSTLDLYHELYLNLVGELERVRLAHIQQTPNIVQIEAASIPKRPVRPIPLLYTLLSGMVGLMLAVGIVFFVEALREDVDFPEDTEQTMGIDKINRLPQDKQKTIPRNNFMETEDRPEGGSETVKASPELLIAELELGKLPTEALAKVGIEKVDQLLSKLAEGEDALLSVTGFGQRSLKDAKKRLHSLGYEFAED